MYRFLFCLSIAIGLLSCEGAKEKQLPNAAPSVGPAVTRPQAVRPSNPTPPAPPQPHTEEPVKPEGKYTEVGYGGEGMSSPILFQKVKHDFGVVKKGAQVKAEYFYKNTSTHSVEIERTIVSCNCITVEHKKDPIHPGETGSIKVTFHTEDQGAASYEKIISVQHKGTQVVQALLLKGKIVL